MGKAKHCAVILADMFTLVGFAFLAPVCSQGQTWSFSGSETCYHSRLPNTPAGLPDQVQCFSRGTLLSLASPTAIDQSFQQYQAYEAGRELGAGVGVLVVVLVKAWEAHHQRVVLEGKDRQRQIGTYLQANMALMDENLAMMDQDLENERRLQMLMPEQRERFVQFEADRGDLILKVRGIREQVRSLECRAVNGKMPRRDFQYALEGQGGAQWTYRLQREQLLKEWVMNRTLALLVASYQGRDIQNPPRTIAEYDRICD